MSDSDDDEPKSPTCPRFIPFKTSIVLQDHQRIEVEAFKRKDLPGKILYHNVGSGKTITSLAIAYNYLTEPKAPNRKIVVIAPKSLKDNFIKEMVKYGFTKSDPHFEFYTYDKTRFLNLADLPKYFMLIVDEAHNLRTKIEINKKTGKVSKGIKSHIIMQISQLADVRVLLTGSLIYNEPYDLANLLAIAQGEDRYTETDFVRLEGVGKYISYHRKTSGYPKCEERKVHLIMSSEYYARYRQVEERKFHLFKAKDPFAFLTVVREATNCLEESPKAEWIVDFIKRNPYDRNLIYSCFVDYGIMQVKKLLRDAGLPFASLSGSDSVRDRNHATLDYNSGEVPTLIITKAGGEGLDLKETDNIFIMEPPWSRQNIVQIIGRGVRFMSHEDPNAIVKVHHVLLVKPNQEEIPRSADVQVYEIIEKKQKKIDEALTKYECEAIAAALRPEIEGETVAVKI